MSIPNDGGQASFSWLLPGCVVHVSKGFFHAECGVLAGTVVSAQYWEAKSGKKWKPKKAGFLPVKIREGHRAGYMGMDFDLWQMIPERELTLVQGEVKP